MSAVRNHEYLDRGLALQARVKRARVPIINKAPASGNAIAYIRAHDIELADAGPDILQAKVRLVQPVGPQLRLDLDFNGQVVEAVLDGYNGTIFAYGQVEGHVCASWLSLCCLPAC